jgi:site-specific DNA-methyltransferase (cytosine-N4-specific)
MPIYDTVLPVDFGIDNPFKSLIPVKPYYFTEYGSAYLGDASSIIKYIPDSSLDLILTSPPYALVFKKEYGNVNAQDYVKWFMGFAHEFHRVLNDEGSLVINIGGSWNKGVPTRSTYQFELIIELAKIFHLAQEFYWFNPAKLPSPAEWVTVKRIRVKDSVELVLWFSKSPYPNADNRRVLQPYSKDMQRIIEKGYVAKKRPSGYNITSKFRKDNNGSIPPNVLQIGNTDSSSSYLQKCKEYDMKPHPARFPKELPQFFIDFLTERGDVVMDPFCGSNVTGSVAEKSMRKWIAIDTVEEYLKGSEFRFPRIYR